MNTAARITLALALAVAVQAQTSVTGGTAVTSGPWTDNGSTVSTTRNVNVGSTLVDAVLGVSNPTPALLPKFRLALAKVRQGSGDAKVLCVGDSTTQGYGGSSVATVVSLNSGCGRLIALANAYVPTAQGLVKALGYTDLASDTRWTLGAGWSVDSSTVLGWARNSVIKSTSSPAENLTFSSAHDVPGGGATYDRYDVYYLSNVAGMGTITVTATGGTPVVKDCNEGVQDVHRLTAAAATASAANTVTISNSGPGVFIMGIEPWNSAITRVRIGNVGVGGSTTAAWADGTAFESIQAIKAYAPDLTILSLSVNDATQSIPAATVQANLAATITAARLSGDVVFVSPVPPHNDPEKANMAKYQTVFPALAHTYNMPIIDLYGRFGGTWQTNLTSDNVHPNDYGYWDWAHALNSFLRQLY